MKTEFRVVTHSELRTAPGNKLEGYAAVFDSPSENLGGFTEVIKPGAFARALRERQDVRALINHSPDLLLGRVKSGTLALTEDSKGLHFRVDLPDVTYARDLAYSVQRGDLSGCSFGFLCKRDSWPQRDKRELLDVDLFDVGPVTFPAYSGTSVQARSRLYGGDAGVVEEVRFYRGISGSEDAGELARLRLRLRLALVSDLLV